MLDVDRELSAAGDLEAEDVAIEGGARLLVVAFQRAVRERLRNVAAAGKLALGKLTRPMRPRDGASFGERLRFVALDLERVAAGLDKVHRAREVLRARRRDALQPVALLARDEMAMRGVDLLDARDAHAVVIVVRLVRRRRSGFVHDEAPGGVRMLEDRFAVRALEDPHRQEIGEDR